jgi:exonuclease III
MPKELKYQYASFNTNCLIKTGKRRTQYEYIRYLRLQKYDITCFQETHAFAAEAIHSLNNRFQSQASFWTEQAETMAFSNSCHLSTTNTSTAFEDSRFQLYKVTHSQNYYESFFILNMYAPVKIDAHKKELFSKLASMLYSWHDQVAFSRLIISGDFNYSLLWSLV